MRRLVRVREQARAGAERNAELLRDFARGVLQSEAPHLLRSRPDERQTRLFTGLREVGIFAQESVARMNRLRPALPRGSENFLHGQVTFATGGGPKCTLSSASRTCSEWASASE